MRGRPHPLPVVVLRLLAVTEAEAPYVATHLGQELALLIAENPGQGGDISGGDEVFVCMGGSFLHRKGREGEYTLVAVLAIGSRSIPPDGLPDRHTFALRLRTHPSGPAFWQALCREAAEHVYPGGEGNQPTPDPFASHSHQLLREPLSTRMGEAVIPFRARGLLHPARAHARMGCNATRVACGGVVAIRPRPS